MERIVVIHIQKLPKGLYLATSDELQGLVVQGQTVAETIESARDVAKHLMELEDEPSLPEVEEEFYYPLIVN
jgi:predicted RNase H-like HicB family nuclease